MKDKIIKAIERVTGEQVDVNLAMHSTNLLFDLGLNSLNLIEFIVELEKTFEMEVDMSALSLTVFDSLDSIAHFVNQNIPKNA
ncbi:acyl carrier protein [Chitinophaga nivalis]|uniref:Acyl carrier protein n=1 Tax=Chitinophaga nivalis TaxID=2991709 RepID=A0ABT3IM20_9BACT|nr:acyl carrier protein [Chitinophaga nivalis]MCW3465315.1 acyl carrier protein [Chitinophaga nivalis]MCW3484993.1 acyl carrier protein [Chitinophaga nivalis]